jgi:hypothetical protein
VKNQHVILFDAVENNDVLAHGKTPQASAQILIARAPMCGWWASGWWARR